MYVCMCIYGDFRGIMRSLPGRGKVNSTEKLPFRCRALDFLDLVLQY